ncbi:MAG: hypothetical protein CFE43_06050 [Burkholderiales bacterium PBB3]|nr:MAG: hypothetical protein CFE43_06050 [Burkholderiales bacterium PBB3]
MRSAPCPCVHCHHASHFGGLAGALVLGIGLWIVSDAAQAAEPLGTLLYSPAQRQAIAAARKRPAGESASLIPLKPSTARLDGVVARESAKGTAWVNGEPMAQGAPKAPLLRGTDAVVEGRRLRVGESVDTTTGSKTDVVAPGAVRKGPTR